MIYLAIGPIQLILIALVLLVPVLFFIIGYYFGKKAGYINRVKEFEK